MLLCSFVGIDFLYQPLQSGCSLSFMAAKYLTKPTSSVHSWARLLPHFMAKRLSLRASGKPISFIARSSLFSSRPSSFLVIDTMDLAKDGLLMLCVTFIAKSISTLSILGKALNHTPARMALHLNLISCFFSMKLKVLFCDVVVGKVPVTSEFHSLESLNTLTFITSQYLLHIRIPKK